MLSLSKLCLVMLVASGALTFWYRFPDLEYFHVNSNQKPNIIFLNGPDEWAKVWTYVSEEWRVLDFANTYALSLPNSGHSFSLDKYTLNNLAAVVVDFINRHDLCNVVLAGSFVGAKVAMQVAALYPGAIEGILVLNAFPFAFADDFVAAEKQAYSGLASINYKRSVAAIRPDLVSALGSNGWANDIIERLQGSDGNYFLPFDLAPFIQNIKNVTGANASKKFKGAVKFLLSEGSGTTPKSLVPQLKAYYPYIDLVKDVVYVNQPGWIWKSNIDLIVSTLRDLTCH